MSSLTTQKPDSPDICEPRRQTVEWHHECLILTLTLASGFSAAKLRKLLLAHKAISPDRIMSPGELLEAGHQACHRNQSLVRAVSKELNNRFKNNLSKIAVTAPGKIKDSLSRESWLFPAMWACYQQNDPAYAEAGRSLAHIMLWQAVKGREKLAPNKAQAEQLDRLCKENKDMSTTIQKLRKELAAARKAREIQNNPTLRPIAAPAGDTRALRRKLKTLKSQINKERDKNVKLNNELAVWRGMALKQGVRGKKRLSPGSQVPANVASFSCPQGRTEPNCCVACPEADALKGRKVAVIGGLDRLEGQYRQVIGRLGGEGVCHNGKLRNGCRKLRQIVNRSDLVVFITPINSHGALHMVKAECKKCTTPFCVMKSAGASSLEDLLVKYAT